MIYYYFWNDASTTGNESTISALDTHVKAKNLKKHRKMKISGISGYEKVNQSQS